MGSPWRHLRRSASSTRSGWRWILVETVGVGQVEVEIAGKADTTIVVVNPGWGDSVQAAKAGLMEVADLFVINKADRPGVDETRRDLQQMLDLTVETAAAPEADGWPVPILPAVATTGEGVVAVWEAVLRHQAFAAAGGLLERRRRARLAEELRDIIVNRLELRARELCTGDRWDDLTARVLDRDLDPWAAADAMLAPVLS